MHKIYWRRLLLPSLILTILPLFFLVFTTKCQTTRGNSVSIIYDERNSFFDSSSTIPIQSSSVPSRYLVVPYQEFVLRTSMACRVFNLDNPTKNANKFHPKYSKYLRGPFPYVLPYTNITYNDIENFYTKILVNKKKDTETIATSFANNITFENIPYIYQESMWHPVGITSAQRTAILVPLQGREYNAKTFLFNMHAFARRQQLTYTIILVEQVSPMGYRFNKGRLFNAAINYLEKKSLNITCLVLHDVDLIPEDDGNLYACETKYPKHTTSRVRNLDSKRGYIRYYEFLIGGVLLLTFDMYKTFNGFSNLYWGWGGEDDDLALRLIQRKMCVVRPAYELAIYIGLPHLRGPRNDGRFSLLKWTTLRLDTDGYAQIESLTRIIDIRQTLTVTHMKLDHIAASKGLIEFTMNDQIDCEEMEIEYRSKYHPIITNILIHQVYDSINKCMITFRQTIDNNYLDIELFVYSCTNISMSTHEAFYCGIIIGKLRTNIIEQEPSKQIINIDEKYDFDYEILFSLLQTIVNNLNEFINTINIIDECQLTSNGYIQHKKTKKCYLLTQEIELGLVAFQDSSQITQFDNSKDK
ncbi:unnamed protein product [Rotaria sp. Silwood1]|nr:unnamed protein product [Rotaria sp. Silwood1]CAF1109222.1 unnamed protein product [Rotaria sp. Silwood1]